MATGLADFTRKYGPRLLSVRYMPELWPQNSICISVSETTEAPSFRRLDARHQHASDGLSFAGVRF